MGMHIGHKAIHRTAVELGFGSRVQDMFSGERPGLIPDSKWKREHTGSGWYPGDTANMSVGQGFVLVNPMQILRLVSLIAARGRIYRPHIVRMIISPSGEVKKKYDPELTGALQIDEDIFNGVIDGMKKVVEHGTARWMNLDLEVAGKTGTAESPAGDDHAWFACFAPVDDPQIAIAVIVEHGGYGATAAMPVARRMLQEKFDLR